MLGPVQIPALPRVSVKWNLTTLHAAGVALRGSRKKAPRADSEFVHFHGSDSLVFGLSGRTPRGYRPDLGEDCR